MQKFILTCFALSIPCIAIGQLAHIPAFAVAGALLMIPFGIAVLGAFLWQIITR